MFQAKTSAPGPARAESPLEPRVEPALEWEELVPRSAYARFVRRPLLIVCTLALLILAVLPMLAIAAILAALNKSPRRVLFVQPRVGHRGRVFRVLKFRTMRPSSALASWSGPGETQRVTRVGRFLRRTHMDELPQLVNILRGDMDLIGPRPEMVEIDRWARQHVAGFSRRLAIRPGLTGLAQIVQGYAGKDVQAYRRKLELDLGYLESLSFAKDVAILLRTVAWVLCCRGWRWDPEGASATPTRSTPSSSRDQAAAEAIPQTTAGATEEHRQHDGDALQDRPLPRPEGFLVDPPVHLVLILALTLAALVESGCSAPPLPKSTTEARTVAQGLPDPVLLGPNDLLQVVVFQHPEFQGEVTYRVSPEGAIHLPLAGSVQIAGKSVGEARRAVETALAQYLREPSAGLTVVEYGSRRVYVLGQVARPGPVVLDRPLTALEALSIAQGLAEGARRDRVVVLRRHGPEDVEVYTFDAETPGPEAFVYLRPDDVVFAPRSGAGVFRDEALPILQGIGFTTGQIAAVAVAADQL